MAEPLDIDARVRSVLAAALNVAESDLAPAATLQGDLGAESIDVLDIVFRLERAFNLKIAQGELFPEAILLGKPEYIADGKVTDKGLALLRSRMPFADLSGLERERRLPFIANLFTVGLLSNYISWKLQGQGGAEVQQA